MEEPEMEEEEGGEMTGEKAKRLEPPSSLASQITSILEASHEGAVSEIDSPSHGTADKTFSALQADGEVGRLCR